MAKFETEEEMLQAVSGLIEQNTGLALATSSVKELLVEVQREQLKQLVYRAFMTVNAPDEKEEAQDG